MISENALTLMKLDDKIWDVKPYDSTTLYFPGFKDTSVFPAYEYDARLTIDCAGAEPFTVADVLEFTLDAQINSAKASVISRYFPMTMLISWNFILTM